MTLIHLQENKNRNKNKWDLKYIIMDQTQSSVKETTINIQHFDTSDIQALHESKMMRLKETKPSQILLYLIPIYFISLAFFYLVLCLKRSRHIECQLQCDEVNLYCQCQIKSRVSWSTPTYVQLSWSGSDRQGDQYEEIVINEAILSDNYSSIKLQIEANSEVNCFPNGCLASVGLIEQSIGDSSEFVIQFNNKIPTSRIQNIKTLFRQVDSSYPQLQAFPQLAINLSFAIVTGVLVFLRQKMDIEVAPPMHIKNKKIAQCEQDQKVKIEVPEDIVALNKQLQRNRSKAIRFLLKRMNKNIQLQTIEDQQSAQFAFTSRL